MTKRLFSLILAFLLLFSLLPAQAESRTATVSYEEVDVKHASTFTIEADMQPFDAESDQYIHKIAQLSLCMALSAFRNARVELDETDTNIRIFLTDLGFEGYQSYGYHEETSMDTISNAIAYRRMTAEDGTAYVLLAVPVCGQGYGNEWQSNFHISSGKVHEGFTSAAQIVYDRVIEYINTNLPGERIKIWCTGYSRSAAVSNVLGDLLLNDPLFKQNDIFCYTFATPNTTTTPTAWPQIYNIINSMDPVPCVPLGDWGYSKNGTTLFLPAPETRSDYADLVAASDRTVHELTGLEGVYVSRGDRNWLVKKIIELLYGLIPDVSLYTDTLQDALQSAWVAEGGMGGKLSTLLNIAEEHGAGEKEHWSTISDELMSLLALGMNETLEMASGEGGTEMWIDLLASGADIAGEHYPRTYVGWMLSDPDGSTLFGPDHYLRLVIKGDVDIQLSVYNEEKEAFTTVLDTENNIKDVVWLKIADTNYIHIPDDVLYYGTVKAKQDTQLQFGIGCQDLRMSASNLSISDPVDITAADTVEFAFARDDKTGEVIKAGIVNEEKQLQFDDQSDPEKAAALFIKNDTEDMTHAVTLVIGHVAMALYLIICVIALICVLVIGIKRLVRGKVNDQAAHRKAGTVMSCITAVCSTMIALFYARCFFIRAGQYGNTALRNKTMQMISGVMRWNSHLYLTCGVILFILLAVLCIRARSHHLSRIRTLSLSLMLILQNVIALEAAEKLQVHDAFIVVQFLVPFFAIVSLFLLHVPRTEEEKHQKKWVRVNRDNTPKE